MKKIKFDSGLETLAIGGGVLRFNPADPNLYVRFQEAAEKLQAVEDGLAARAGEDDGGEAVIRLLRDADLQMKQILGWVFGPDNDFDAITGGVNLLAVASNGERVVTNLFAALEPVLVAGAKACAQQQTSKAVARANSRRAAQ